MKCATRSESASKVWGILVTNSVCWARFERASLGRYSLAALSWMFRHAKLAFALLLQKSAQVVLSQHGITWGSLVVDDADRARTGWPMCIRSLTGSVRHLAPRQPHRCLDARRGMVIAHKLRGERVRAGEDALTQGITDLERHAEAKGLLYR